MDGASARAPQPRVDPVAVDLLGRLVELAHGRSRTEPICGPDLDGVFPPTPGFNILGLATAAPPVVPDTNLLSRDIGWTVRTGSRGVLINAANSGALRLLCPAHVADEIVSHADEFCGQMQIEPAEYLATWRRDYLPLLRIINEFDDEIFIAAERERLNTLANRDPDDVPAAKLALAAGGFLFSDDGPVLDAVYGPTHVLNRDEHGHTKWVDALKGWGNTHELRRVIESGALLARLVGFGVAGTIRQTRATPRTATALGIAALGAAVLAYQHADTAKKAAMRRGIGTASNGILELLVKHAVAAQEVARLAAPSQLGSRQSGSAPMLASLAPVSTTSLETRQRSSRRVNSPNNSRTT